ncbi:PREDICTED: 39S ribosomal protein L23, mitochondrial [Gekko japonicus]|uniref:Large ribosomal subunit protein uL23m n=1 Tax=Gekko japonicus TaxID=146911 RepID=A0ABM1L5K8_GEKJA|nr:PREDICTED: 39S ribosomal protein L23, mitochondrial [Gekko japonicus]
MAGPGRLVYPLYQFGNPQIRIFRTNYFLTMVRPGVRLPEDTVQFRIPMVMTRLELKDYLENIYKVPVAAIRTRIQHGSRKQRDHRNRPIKKPDYKVAYVQLGAGQTFQFPDLFPERPEAIEPGSLEDIQRKFMKDEAQRQQDDPKRSGVPRWFGL